MGDIRIRKVDGDDFADELRDLHDQTFGDEAPQIDPLSTEHWWIASHEGHPVAFAGAMPSIIYEGSAYFKRVGVIPAFRGQHLQVRLMKTMEAELKRLGYRGAISDTSQNIPSAKSFIQRGWTLFDPGILAWGSACTLYWRKDFHRG